MRFFFVAILIGISKFLILAPEQPIAETSSDFHPGTEVRPQSRNDSCYICHGERELALRQESAELCFPCHNASLQKSEMNYQHIKIDDNNFPGLDCEGCHKLHRAPADHYLRQDEQEFCLSCHETAGQFKSHPVVMHRGHDDRMTAVIGSDGRVVNCASHCHDVHGAEYQFLCRLEPGRELCVSCHEEFR